MLQIKADPIQPQSKLTPEQFAYWLQGYAEISGATAPTSEQWVVIKEHLNLVFHKVTSTQVPRLTTGVAIMQGACQQDSQSQVHHTPDPLSSVESIANSLVDAIPSRAEALAKDLLDNMINKDPPDLPKRAAQNTEFLESQKRIYEAQKNYVHPKKLC